MSRATLRREELVQPKPERSHMPLLVENVRAELGLESILEHAPIDDTSPDEKLDVRPIARAVPAELRENEVVDLEGTKPKVLEASRSQIDESGGVAFGILRDRHAMKLQTVPPRNLAAFAGDEKQLLTGLRRSDLDTIDVARRPRKLVEDAEDETSETMNLDRPSQRVIDFAEKV